MKRLFSVLRGRKGMTLIEMVVGAGLLCVVIGIFSASLRPAAEITRRTQELNSAEVIADDLLETIRGEVENATGYVKCYASSAKADVIGGSGAASGAAIEFQNESGFTVLLSADGCPETDIYTTGSDTPTKMNAIDSGYLTERYYRHDRSNGYDFADAAGKPIARAMALVYPKGFYMGLQADLSFEVNEGAHTVTATADIYRVSGADRTKLFSDSQVIDLRYKVPLKSAVTAKQKTADDL